MHTWLEFLKLIAVNHGNTIAFFLIFWTKGHNIVEILALLTTELSSSKIYKVGMLLCIPYRLYFNINYNTERF